MAGKCKEMNKIKQALRLHLDGESNRSIGRKLDLYKGTVNKYITLAESCGIPIPVLLSMEEPEIERVLTGGNPAYSDSRFQELKKLIDPVMVSASLSPVHPEITFSLSIPVATAEEKQQLSAILVQRKYKWEGRKFNKH